MAVKVTMDRATVKARIKGRFDEHVRPALAEQILKDSNFYARRDTGTLIDSSQTASDFGKGIVAWDTAYAKKVYYTGSPVKDKNPNASLQWVETARKQRGKDWQKLGQKKWDDG